MYVQYVNVAILFSCFLNSYSKNIMIFEILARTELQKTNKHTNKINHWWNWTFDLKPYSYRDAWVFPMHFVTFK